jgi:hypothetical protein
MNKILAHNKKKFEGFQSSSKRDLALDKKIAEESFN